MTIAIYGTNGGKIDVDRLCNCVNSLAPEHRRAVFWALREEFPEIVWTRHANDRVVAYVHADYRP